MLIALRYFNPVDSDSEGLLGDLQPIPHNLLPFVLQTAMGIRESLGVFGNDYETRDGKAIRNYIDANDLADAHVKVIKRLLKAKNKYNLEFFNLGSGNGSTVFEILTAFEQVNNLKINYEIKPRRTEISFNRMQIILWQEPN